MLMEMEVATNNRLACVCVCVCVCVCEQFVPDSPLSDRCSVHICFEMAYRRREDS